MRDGFLFFLSYFSYKDLLKGDCQAEELGEFFSLVAQPEICIEIIPVTIYVQSHISVYGEKDRI